MLKLFKKETKSPVVQSNINSLLREGSDFFSNELILLNEKLSGNLFCAEKTIIEQNGTLSGNITTKVCVISGTVNGNILSTEQTEIRSSAVITGNVRSPSINIQPGALISGHIVMTKDTDTVNLLEINMLDKIKKHTAQQRLAMEKSIGAAADTAAAINSKEKNRPDPSIPVKAAKDTPAKSKPQTQQDDINQKWW